MLAPLVSVLRWTGATLRSTLGLRPGAQRTLLGIGSAGLFVGIIVGLTTLGLHPLLTLVGGLGLAVLLVVARSWMVVQEHPPAE